MRAERKRGKTASLTNFTRSTEDIERQQRNFVKLLKSRKASILKELQQSNQPPKSGVVVPLNTYKTKEMYVRIHDHLKWFNQL